MNMWTLYFEAKINIIVLAGKKNEIILLYGLGMWQNEKHNGLAYTHRQAARHVLLFGP